MDHTFTIMETRKMSKHKLEVEIGKHAKYLEELGVSHIDACEFVSSVMNLGIAIQESENRKKTNNCYGKD